jgi:hypothetical protein
MIRRRSPAPAVLAVVVELSKEKARRKAGFFMWPYANPTDYLIFDSL